MVRAVVAAAAAAALAALAAGPASASSARAERALAHRLSRSLVAPGVARKRTAALAIDLRSGRVVYSLHADRPLAPASNEKLTVTYAALLRLGGSFRWHTTLYGAGHRSGATWRGNLFLRGGGDPTLTTNGLARLATQLRREGIRRVRGDVLADESAFDTRRTAPGWTRGDYLVESPPLSALVVQRAQFRGATSPDPAGAAAALLVDTLRAHGIRVTGRSAWGTTPVGATRLAQVGSRPLVQVLRFMDRQSDNFTAEMLLKTLGGGTTAAGARVVRETLAAHGIPLAGDRIVDGSGLSRLDRLTTRTLGAILVAAWRSPRLRPVLWDSLAAAGMNGTLAYRLQGYPIHAKTGTTAIASALSGYVGSRYVFSVVQDGHPIATWPARDAQDRFAVTLAG